MTSGGEGKDVNRWETEMKDEGNIEGDEKEGNSVREY